jgi:hypothetical protein
MALVIYLAIFREFFDQLNGENPNPTRHFGRTRHSE